MTRTLRKAFVRACLRLAYAFPTPYSRVLAYEGVSIKFFHKGFFRSSRSLRAFQGNSRAILREFYGNSEEIPKEIQGNSKGIPREIQGIPREMQGEFQGNSKGSLREF